MSEMKRHHIGVPPHIVTLLKPNLESEANKNLLEELEDVHSKQQEHWSEDRIKEFLEERKKLFPPQRRSGSVPIYASGYVDPKNIPDTIPEMERLFGVLEKREKYSRHLNDKLMEALIKDGRRDDCLALYERIKTKQDKWDPNFKVSRL